jgi:type I restriction enzyme R subunit
MTTNKITESAIEEFAIELLEKSGYQYIYAPDIAPDSETPERAKFEDVFLLERLRKAVCRINPKIPADVREEAIKQIQRLNSPELIANNEAFHRMLTEGVKVSYQKDGADRGDLVWLIDFNNPENNEFLVANQFTVIENNVNKRPDIILFVNGLPLIVIELKNPADDNATVKSAFKQLQTYKQAIPGLFTYNGFMVISDGLEAKVGSLSAGFSRFMSWKSSDGKVEASPLIGQLETLIKGMLTKTTLLDLIRHFIVFEKFKKEDKETGIITIQTMKKLAAYHQYYAVNKAVENTIKAASTNGNRKGGVVWHTQGSGKSISMVFYTAKLVLSLNNPTVVVITDRNDLDDQLFDTFAAGGIVFTTIQKFLPEAGRAEYDRLSERTNIVVIADEAHRTQYGFQAKLVDIKDKETKDVIGKRIAYGFAKYMRDALPNATYIGFTGTPIEGTDVNTPAVFGQYVDIYDISQSIADGATVRIYYESRLARDIVTHFGQRTARFEGKGLIVAMSHRIAVDLYNEIIKLKPEWHNDDLSKGAIKVVMTAVSADGPVMQKHHTTKSQRRDLSDRMKDHGLMQAIARVNRVFKDKPGGLVVDYLGIATDLKKALSFYSNSGGKGDPAEGQEKAVATMLEKLEVVRQLFYQEKLSIILQAEEHIMGLEDGKNRLIREVSLLSQALALSVPDEQALAITDEVAKKTKENDEREAHLGLSKEELAFYDALAEKVKANATIDWTIRESARAKLMVMVKRTLNKYGYPPDMQQKAIDTVLKQAELLADYFVRGKEE